MKPIKLTKAQIDLLEMASNAQGNSRGYWMPFKYELAEVYGTHGTAKALCGKGLLEYHVYLEAAGRYPAVLEYRITQAGRDWLDSQKSHKS